MEQTMATPFYNSLPLLDESKRVAIENRSCLRKLGDVICAYGLHEQFGICLLHKHFEIEGGERVTHINNPNQNQVHVVPTSDLSSALSGCIWGLSQQDDYEHWTALEYLNTSGFHVKYSESSEKLLTQERFLEQFHSSLHEMGLQQHFGLGVFHRDAVHLPDGQVLAEFSDEANRYLTVTNTTPNRIDPFHSTTTMWRFSPGADPMSASLCCHQHGPTCSGDRH